MLLNMASTC